MSSSNGLNVNAPEFYPKHIMKIKKIYDNKIKGFIHYELKNNNEMAHILQDGIYRDFIKDIYEKKLDKIDEIQFISKMIIEQVIIHDKKRWYA